MHAALAPASEAGSAIPVQLVRRADWEGVKTGLAPAFAAFAAVQGFKGGEGELVVMPDAAGAVSGVLFGLGDNSDPRTLISLGAKLPPGTYRLAEGAGHLPAGQAVAMFVDGAYRFSKYIERRTPPPRLVVPDGVDADDASAQAEAADLLRDLVNTPTEDMQPHHLEGAMTALARTHGADTRVYTGPELVEHNFPLVHAVGRASEAPPRLVHVQYGDPSHPVVAIVGKGVCFDTGGLNLKTGNYMRDMKKDMGGAAHAIALASLVMTARLPVRLHLIVPAVENSVASNSFRPGDVYRSRLGKTVEIDNTDAEGRLILADALAYACEQKPDLVMDFATLTGAARVALGADLAPFYTDDANLAASVDIAAIQTGDPVWRMPLWKPYLNDLSSTVADFVNSGGAFAGSVTAALFLQQFVSVPRWVHFDIWAWRQSRYGRPAGAAACGLRASWQMLKDRYGP